MVLLRVSMVIAEEAKIVYSHRDSEDKDINYISLNKETPDKEESKHEQGVHITCNLKKNKKRKNKMAKFECNKQR